MSELAIDQCVAELRAACRRPVDRRALEMLVDRLRPSFEQVLDHPDGALRWADHGQRMRDNARYLGGLADFFGHQSDASVVGISELLQAFSLVEAACTVGAERSTRR
jgi:hypothetical protein